MSKNYARNDPPLVSNYDRTFRNYSPRNIFEITRGRNKRSYATVHPDGTIGFYGFRTENLISPFFPLNC